MFSFPVRISQVCSLSPSISHRSIPFPRPYLTGLFPFPVRISQVCSLSPSVSHRSVRLLQPCLTGLFSFPRPCLTGLFSLPGHVSDPARGPQETRLWYLSQIKLCLDKSFVPTDCHNKTEPISTGCPEEGIRYPPIIPTPVPVLRPEVKPEGQGLGDSPVKEEL